MQFVNFPESNRVLGKPATMTDAECGSLPVYADGRQCVSCWQPSAVELAALNAGVPVYLGILVSTDPARPSFTQPPVYVTVGKPDMPPIKHQLTEKYAKALRFIAGLLPIPETASEGLVEGADIRANMPDLPHLAGEEIEEGKQYLITSEDAIEQHYAALVEAFELQGPAGVVDYLRPYAAFLPKDVVTQA